MVKYLVEITRAAESDVELILSHISQDSPGAGRKWVEELERQVDSLESFPKRCSIIPESEELCREYRHLLYGAYRTIFRIEGSKVIIMRVIHSARLLELSTLA